jgi:ribulose-phosphate 3-epimerase
MTRTLIAPSILSCRFSELAREIKDVEEAGADLIHIDVMDGHFVPNITVGPLIVQAVRDVSTLPLDVHLMIENPARYVKDFIAAGADIITLHAEADVHLFRTIDVIRSSGRKASVSLNPSTSEEALKYVMGVADMVLVMTVNPGFGGQKYISAMERKIERIREMIAHTGRKVDLEVDGGIKAENALTVVNAGANVLVMGTEIFHSKNYKAKIAEIRRVLGETEAL